MKIKTSELIGPALDWAVAKIEGVEWLAGDLDAREYQPGFKPSTDGGQGVPIIERERPKLEFDSDWEYEPANAGPDDEPDNGDRWLATLRAPGGWFTAYGPTMLIAAMRCLVSSRLGDEVEIPEELTQ